ncbi:acyl carrier protein [Ruminococcus sp.]|uniref:acyl carrier protein n=1 Tax=Ruminococcus sp. TaxID=41978 RepID=UPI0026243613|nr:acyl carrier protein [Ruminococcus sp.]MDD6988725.1 acyl carrier protein [Ruminococcus sp.]MDY6201475.1 acyl carrier protein [Ruminococcus sp.]
MIDKMRELITNYVDVSPAEISEDSKFIDNLGFNSYDFMSFLGEIEDEFDIEIDEREALKIHTVGEAIKYIESAVQ